MDVQQSINVLMARAKAKLIRFSTLFNCVEICSMKVGSMLIIMILVALNELRLIRWTFLSQSRMLNDQKLKLFATLFQHPGTRVRTNRSFKEVSIVTTMVPEVQM